MAKRITIIGDGGMGTVCAVMLAENGLSVRLWSAFPESAARLAEERENKRFLPGCPLPDGIEVTGDDSEAFVGSDLAISAVPTQFIRRVWRRLGPHCPQGLPICSVSKGIENETLLSPTQILTDVLGEGSPPRSIAAFSGPCIAPEVAKRLPATVVAASKDKHLAELLQELFARPYFRVYTNPDLIGVETAGATKNVIAIAAGVLDGMESGCNAKASLLTRGLAEITRLGLALGAQRETFAGLAGMGDLVTTCFSPIGRNRTFGELIGRGDSVEEALAKMGAGKDGMVVEGLATTAGMVELAAKCKVEMPITQAVHDVLFSGRKPADAIVGLMTRPLKAES